jgi:hypothetical protein
MERQEERFLFLEEFEYDANPGRKAFQLFDIDSAILYVFVCREDCRKEEFLEDRILTWSQEPDFLKTCQLIAGRMGEVAPTLFGRKVLILFWYFLYHSSNTERIKV